MNFVKNIVKINFIITKKNKFETKSKNKIIYDFITKK